MPHYRRCLVLSDILHTKLQRILLCSLVLHERGLAEQPFVLCSVLRSGSVPADMGATGRHDEGRWSDGVDVECINEAGAARKSIAKVRFAHVSSLGRLASTMHNQLLLLDNA